MDAARRANRFGWDGSGGPIFTHTQGAAVPDPIDPKTLNLDDVKKGLARLLPVLKPIARLTPNRVDDLAVAFLESLLENPAKLEAAAVHGG